MVVGIDIRVLGSKNKSGIEEYTENLLSHLLRSDKGIKFKLFYSSLRSKLPEYDWLGLDNVELHRFKLPNKLLFASAGLFNTPKVDRLIGGADVFFSPHFFLAPLSAGCKRVTTFHDLSYVHFPEFFSFKKNYWHNLEMKPVMQSRFSDRIIAVSESTKNDLVNIYKLDPAKIDVVYSGVSPQIFRPSESELKEFRNKKNLPEKFILFLGKLEPRKNITGIVRAFNGIREEMPDSDLNLVIVGSRGWLYKDIFAEINKSPYRKNIILKNHISDTDRKFYYSLASVFVYPSYFEGFGFPPLEAMACGTPVVTSNTSSLPEVVGRAGILINPENTEEMAGAITSIINDKDLSVSLAGIGLAKSQTFNWQTTAEKTLRSILSSVGNT